MEAKINDSQGKNESIEMTAPSDLTSGEVVATHLGCGIVAGLNAQALTEGMKVTITVGGLALMKADATDTFDAGDHVAWDDDENELVDHDDAAADFHAGVIVTAKASGEEFALVDLNKHPAPDVGT